MILMTYCIDSEKTPGASHGFISTRTAIHIGSHKAYEPSTATHRTEAHTSQAQSHLDCSNVVLQLRNLGNPMDVRPLSCVVQQAELTQEDVLLEDIIAEDIVGFHGIPHAQGESKLNMATQQCDQILGHIQANALTGPIVTIEKLTLQLTTEARVLQHLPPVHEVSDQDKAEIVLAQVVQVSPHDHDLMNAGKDIGDLLKHLQDAQNSLNAALNRHDN